MRVVNLIVPSLNPELEHALFVQDYQRDDMEVD